MKSYSEERIFDAEEIRLLRRATSLVERVRSEVPRSAIQESATRACDPRELVTPSKGEIRCHELARAVGRVLSLEFIDGSYGFVDHTWLWTTPFPKEATEEALALGFPNILDVYAVGQLPQVRLVSCRSGGALPHVGWSYRPGRPRTDIDWKLVQELVAEMRGT